MKNPKPHCHGCRRDGVTLGTITITVSNAGPNGGMTRHKANICGPACAARVMLRVGAHYEADMTPGGVLASDHRVGLWDAVNRYAAACGGDTGGATVSGARMDAVVAVEDAASGADRGPHRTIRANTGIGDTEAA